MVTKRLSVMKEKKAFKEMQDDFTAFKNTIQFGSACAKAKNSQHGLGPDVECRDHCTLIFCVLQIHGEAQIYIAPIDLLSNRSALLRAQAKSLGSSLHELQPHSRSETAG